MVSVTIAARRVAVDSPRMRSNGHRRTARIAHTAGRAGFGSASRDGRGLVVEDADGLVETGQ